MQLENFIKDLSKKFDFIPNEDRRAKVGTGSLISVLVFFFIRDRGNSRTLESLRKLIQESFKTNFSRGGFWERLATNKLRSTLESFACSMLQSSSVQLGITKDLLSLLKVTAILVIDSTSSSLPRGAKAIFPAPRNNVAPSAVKLHMCFNLFKGAVEWFNITEATSHDRNSFPSVETLKNKLIIFDLGYWDYTLLSEIIKIGGFFLTRVKSTASIKIIEVISGLPKKYEGWCLFDRKYPAKPQKIIEIMGEFSQNYKPLFSARVIGFWNPIKCQYHWYVTNLIAPAEIIYPLYRLRWQIELIFKALKSSFRLADFTTANPNIIYTLIFSALIATIITYPIGLILAAEFKKNKQLTPSFQRAAMIIANSSKEFIEYFLSKSYTNLQLLIESLKRQKRELIDPNFNKRNSSLYQLIFMAESLV